MKQQLGLFEHLTHRANLRQTRYGWLRLTPAYSVHLVEDLLASTSKNAIVLDPFCGTGTTALVCAERGIRADTTDINPFLIWLATTKTRRYNEKDLQDFQFASTKVAEAILGRTRENGWIPPLHQIEKWWDDLTLHALSRAMKAIHSLEYDLSLPAIDLLKIVFCRLLIVHSSASFNHQSMSFKTQQNQPLFEKTENDIAATWKIASADIYRSAQTEIIRQPRALLCDARQLTPHLPNNHYTCVITSPPYPNRMSYIRELRPYMYWLGYLKDSRQAGELDWQAIGGTWGCATSNVARWKPEDEQAIPYDGFEIILEGIAARSNVLSRYVHKYFYDMVRHAGELLMVLKSGATVHYIVGNSKFYEVLLPVEEIFAALFRASGFADVSIKPIRKRTSKKELFEYIVSARKP
jgi:hypothetical protein